MQRFKKFVFPVVAVLGIAIFSIVGRTSATDVDYVYEGEPEVVAVTFASAWCSVCKILEPRLAEVVPEFSDKPVKFVRLDFTFGQTGSLETQAEAEGLSDLYPRFKGATGFTLLVDRDTGELLDSLTVNHSKDAMRTAIAQAIALAQREKNADPS
ncbi:thioredoxin domain-containing protein [Hyphococcus lacteus]|uniref:Thioredoxin domain-containing protein n=1 Tax=Hyphococcus lacteus TaxID=3143536 RepID=A0ABV3Z0U4_9PROT